MNTAIFKIFQPSTGFAATTAILALLLSLPLLTWSGVLLVPEIIPAQQFLAIHLACEVFAMLVSVLVFVSGYKLTEEKRPAGTIVLAAAFLNVALLDFLHLMTFPGMPDFIGPADIHHSLLFWLAARLISALALLVYVILAPTHEDGDTPRIKELSPSLVLGLFTLSTTILAVLVFSRPEVIPPTFDPSQGLTPFKIAMEWLVIGIHLLTLAALALRRGGFGSTRLSCLAGALLVLIGSELFFTLYSVITDSISLLGHLYKIIGYALICRCIFVENLRKPLVRLAQAHQNIKDRYAFQQMLSQISTSFVHTPTGRIPATIDRVLRRCVDFFTADRAYLFLFSADGRLVSNDYEQCAPGISPQKDFLQNIPVEATPWFIGEILDQRTILLPSLEHLPPTATAERELLNQQQIKSLITTPLISEGRVLGFFGFDAVRESRAWTGLEVENLKVIAGLIAAAINKQRLEEQLIQARKMESLGVLAGGIAHDFNNILTPIIIHTQMSMLQLPETSPAREPLKQIRLAAERAAALIRQIMDFSRQSGNKPVALRLSSIIDEAVKLLHSSLSPGIEIDFTPDPAEEPILADPTQMLQVVMNLVVNASHAIDEEGKEGGAISIKLGRESSPSAGRPRLKLVISDSGRGISPEHLGRIFDPFFTTKNNRERSGMGLAVVHGIVTAHRGEIAVKSTPGQGTSFTILLPTTRQNEPLPNGAGKMPGGGESILLVDDEAAVLEATTLLLQRLGYRVTACRRGEEALEIFKEQPEKFDLVICDYHMPELNGLEIIRRLRAIREKTKAIICTGFTSELERESLGKSEEWIIRADKPFKIEEFSQLIRETLDSPQSR